MSLLFNMLSWFVTNFLPRSKRLLISWLQSLSAVILEPKKIKSVTAPTFLLLFAMKCGVFSLQAACLLVGGVMSLPQLAVWPQTLSAGPQAGGQYQVFEVTKSLVAFTQ